MRPNPKNNDVTEIELYPEVEITDSSDVINVLIKHDYFSSDNEYGRSLLEHMMDALLSSPARIGVLMIIDKGVLMLDMNDDLNSKITRLMEKSDLCLISEESLEYYNIPYGEDLSSHLAPDERIASQIIETQPLLILE
ncbi:MAG: hypothetical protein II718_06995 [Clostridiales bacterium]|nr:hypothetical protein [Clostridiales bacterium]